MFHIASNTNEKNQIILNPNTKKKKVKVLKTLTIILVKTEMFLFLLLFEYLIKVLHRNRVLFYEYKATYF